MQQNRAILWGTLLLTLLAAAISLTFPVPPTYPLSTTDFYIRLVANVTMASLYIGAAILFAVNLNVYKAKLRQAYTLITIGVAVAAVGTMQVCAITSLDAWYSPYVVGGGMMLPFFISAVICYAAVRLLALALGVTNWLTKKIWVIMVTFLAALLTALLPHVPTNISETAYDTGIGIVAWGAGLLVIAAVLAITIQKHVGSLYTKPMQWLAGALFISGLILTLQCTYSLVSTDYDHIITQINTFIAIISGFTWLRAGHAFALTKYYKENISMLRILFNDADIEIINQPNTVIDMVTYTAGLASNPVAVDPLLDPVRAITNKLKPGQKPSANDTQLLLSTYAKIEQYLLTKERVRMYSKQELREALPVYLRKLVEDHEGKK